MPLRKSRVLFMVSSVVAGATTASSLEVQVLPLPSCAGIATDSTVQLTLDPCYVEANVGESFGDENL